MNKNAKAYFLSPEERLKAAHNVFAKTIKTANIGNCIDCGGYTSSGSNTFCQECAGAIIKAADSGQPIPAPSIAEVRKRLSSI